MIVDVDHACGRWMWIEVWSRKTPPTPPPTNATTHHPTTTPTSTPNTNTTPHQLHPPHDEKTAWSSPLFPVEAKPPTCQPCSRKNRFVVRALVEWMNWMVGEETGLSSPKQLRRLWLVAAQVVGCQSHPYLCCNHTAMGCSHLNLIGGET